MICKGDAATMLLRVHIPDGFQRSMKIAITNNMELTHIVAFDLEGLLGCFTSVPPGGEHELPVSPPSL